MSKQFESLIKTTLSNLNDLTPDKINHLMHEAIKTFTELKELGNSNKAEDREEAMKIAASIKETVDHQSEELTKLSGMDEEVLQSYIDNPNFASQEMQDELENARVQFEILQKEFRSKDKKPMAKSRKNKSNWVAG